MKRKIYATTLIEAFKSGSKYVSYGGVGGGGEGGGAMALTCLLI